MKTNKKKSPLFWRTCPELISGGLVRVLLLLVITSIIFTACNKDDDEPIETTPTEQATLLNKKWVQQKWYRDSIDGEMLNTLQTWEFLNDSVMKRTVSFPNTTEYQTYTIYDTWRHPFYNTDIEINTDSLFYITNSGNEGYMNGGKIYKQISLTDNELVLEYNLLPYSYEKFVFKAE